MLKVKKYIAALLIGSLVFLLTGCKNQIPDMTQEQSDLITEYAAGLLLEYHADYEGRLVDTSVAPENELLIQQPSPEESIVAGTQQGTQTEDAAQNGSSVSESTVPEEQVEKPKLTLAQVLGMDGIDVAYKGYELCGSYPQTESSPEELIFAMSAGPGNQLLVLKINVTNVSGQEITCNTLALTDMDCKIVINGNDTRNAYISMLENDFMAINRVIVPGETIETVVVTEMPESDAAQIGNVQFRLKNGSLSTIVEAE